MLIKKCPDCKCELVEIRETISRKILQCPVCLESFEMSTGRTQIEITGKVKARIR